MSPVRPLFFSKWTSSPSKTGTAPTQLNHLKSCDLLSFAAPCFFDHHPLWPPDPLFPTTVNGPFPHRFLLVAPLQARYGFQFLSKLLKWGFCLRPELPGSQGRFLTPSQSESGALAVVFFLLGQLFFRGWPSFPKRAVFFLNGDTGCRTFPVRHLSV